MRVLSSKLYLEWVWLNTYQPTPLVLGVMGVDYVEFVCSISIKLTQLCCTPRVSHTPMHTHVYILIHTLSLEYSLLCLCYVCILTN